MLPKHWTKVIVFAFLVMLLSGCNGGGDQAFSGVVTFRGEPLNEGTIQFFSTGERSAVRAGAMIRKGKYEVSQEHGLKPGTYLVRISSVDIVEAAQGGSFKNPFPSGVRECIPSQYNAESKLIVEVRAGERNEFHFALK